MNSFPKRNKLCGDIHIQRVFAQGQAAVAYPLRVCWLLVPANEPQQALVSVPKRLFKRAVKRNRLKRLMRETYRLNNGALQAWCAEHRISMHLTFSYIAKEEADYKTMEKGMKKAFAKIMDDQDALLDSSQTPA